MQMITTVEIPPHTDRPNSWRYFELQDILDLVQQLEGFQPLSIHLVDVGDDRYVPQPTYLNEQLAGLALNAASCIDDHDRRINGRQRPIRVFLKSPRGPAYPAD